MKVGIVSESPADDAGLKILVEAILGRTVEPEPLKVRTRGWTAVLGKLPGFYKALHWNSDAEGIIAVIDSDDTTPHDDSHEASGFDHPRCRLCEIYRIIQDVQRNIAPRSHLPPLKFAIGLAVPAIEAWYRCGKDVHSTEARFKRELTQSLQATRRQLKLDTYGSVAPPSDVLIKHAREECTRLATQLNLLELHFPTGFGVLARSLRKW